MAAKKTKSPTFKSPLLLFGLVAVVIIAGFIYLRPGSKEAAPKGKYDTFAQCLQKSGMRMYGSVTCSFCAKQRKLFGDSFQHIKEIECDPRNDNNEAERCIAKKISHTPTWIFEDDDGNDVHRFKSGVQPLEELGKVSECSLAEDEI
ncbi:hypothetical protein CMO96_04840 [Candidatus Woesebacteria bacterium]|nr:hypothetical protein [Candidatus Woesebacteria bacterium]